MTSVLKLHYVLFIVGHLVYWHRRLNELKNSCISDTRFVGYTLSGHNLNACIHLHHFCLYSMLREYKDGLRKAILRNNMLLGCLLQDSPIVCSCY